MMAAEEQRINYDLRRKDLDHNGTLEAILYNLTIDNNMSLDEHCRGDGVNQHSHPKITISSEENQMSPSQTQASDPAFPTTKGVNNNATSSSSTKHKSRPLSNYLEVPQSDISKLTVMPMPCNE